MKLASSVTSLFQLPFLFLWINLFLFWGFSFLLLPLYIDLLSPFCFYLAKCCFFTAWILHSCWSLPIPPTHLSVVADIEFKWMYNNGSYKNTNKSIWKFCEVRLGKDCITWSLLLYLPSSSSLLTYPASLPHLSLHTHFLYFLSSFSL